jgi:methionyl-tRNA formyltransferase
VAVRTVYLGTSQFATAVLAALAASDHRPALVVTPPDRRQGRGRRLAPPPVALAARKAGLELLQADNVNEAPAREAILGADPDVVVVCAFGQIIREPLLGAVEMLNVHPSLLPRWRGAAPIERAIMAGDARTGVSIIRLTEGLDSGPIALAEPIAIEAGEAFGSLAERLAELGGALMVRALDAHERGELRMTEQDEALATYAEKVSPDERRLDPARPAIELERVVRALTPHIGAHLELAGASRLGVREASAVAGDLEQGELAAGEGQLLLGCGDGALRLDAVQPPGGRPMAAADYLRGRDVPSRAV